MALMLAVSLEGFEWGVGILGCVRVHNQTKIALIIRIFSSNKMLVLKLNR